MIDQIKKDHKKWIVDRPTDWKIKRYKQIFEERNERSETGDETLLSVSAFTGITPRSELIDQEDLVSKENSLVGYKKCYSNDLVMNIMLAWNKGLAFSKFKGIVSPAYAVFRVISNDNISFLNYLVRDEETSLYFKSYSKGIIDSRLRLYPEYFSQLYCCLPDIETQNKIVKFLDKETIKIDKLIEKQKKLITLFNERINTLVLDGLKNSNTKYVRLKHVCDVISRLVDQKEHDMYRPLGLYNKGRGIFIKNERQSKDMGDSDFFWIKKGDLIFSGQFAWEGAVAMANLDHEDCVASHRYPVIRGKKGLVLTEYLLGLFLTNHGDFLLNQNSRGAAGRNRPLNISLLLKEKIPIIDLKLQEKIKLLIDSKDRFMRKSYEQIKLFEEYRVSIINAGVKGKIDLRKL